jgi:predicted MFS family arabinose efflux permease
MYLITGVFSMGAGPLTGMLADSLGKYKVFFIGSILFVVIVTIYCNLGITPFWMVTTISVFMFLSVTARIIASQALITAVPAPADRGAFMSINSAVQQVSGGIATIIAGMIIVKDQTGDLHNYPTLGIVVVVATLITLALFFVIHRMVNVKQTKAVG